MNIFVYSDYSENKADYKQIKYPVITTVFVCSAESILEADKLLLDTTGLNAVKKPQIGCAVFKLDEFLLYFTSKLNQNSEEILKYKLIKRGLEYTIYGLENPWIKTAPEYSI